MIDLNVIHADAPHVHTRKLDTVWFQVGGTICNLRCHHCFISCTPENDKFKFLSLATCQRYLDEARKLGVKEYYFTGGEPFANPEMCDILEASLRQGASTVLTNATLLRDRVLDRLAVINKGSEHTLELRVSLDGHTPEMNDPIRGEGTFDKAMDGVRQLVTRGFTPIMTITRTWCGTDEDVLAGFVAMLKSIGYESPRLKILPLLKLGAETDRGGAYGPEAKLTHEMMEGFDESELVCSAARLVTDQGVWVCPILLDSPEARMGDTLEETIRDYPLGHAACHTCWRYGAICSNDTGCSAESGCGDAVSAKKVDRGSCDADGSESACSSDVGEDVGDCC